ncbi:Dol-P-Man:Man(7)GlcNAc(2)-PP-Dol alpha-1,6-mannosyltransferase [Platanthera guangdongensis]|uniref:Dol-P-Man:Man(7)GlcNAc(2)-PP-Dol alpha-1,6-mannosyltransferase n=1 Tax=Platanthera guangdongensis TaxID=2320717 RepID=A0ABR2LPQ5_9ASPA
MMVTCEGLEVSSSHLERLEGFSRAGQPLGMQGKVCRGFDSNLDAGLGLDSSWVAACLGTVATTIFRCDTLLLFGPIAIELLLEENINEFKSRRQTLEQHSIATVQNV